MSNVIVNGAVEQNGTITLYVAADGSIRATPQPAANLPVGTSLPAPLPAQALKLADGTSLAIGDIEDDEFAKRDGDELVGGTGGGGGGGALVYEVLTGAGAVSPTIDVTYISKGAGAMTFTLAAGTTDGFRKRIYLSSQGGGEALITGAFRYGSNNDTEMRLQEQHGWLEFAWNTALSKWMLIGSNYTNASGTPALPGAQG